MVVAATAREGNGGDLDFRITRTWKIWPDCSCSLEMSFVAGVASNDLVNALCYCNKLSAARPWVQRGFPEVLNSLETEITKGFVVVSGGFCRMFVKGEMIEKWVAHMGQNSEKFKAGVEKTGGLQLEATNC
ncbi:hypothetical protein C5167_019626 [Papaver somniferum]|uniref:Uncharacterized protein n=1 Tax=Papaver somniferum TaxID=3469 RepID=A0A4Y7IR75_PAPSO|nr:hypothetical protein C5167_019626 [Papaver somniferum]